MPTTGRIKAFAIDKTSSALWLGKQGNDTLQRVYGISFSDKKELAEWKLFQEEAKKRDHRRIGEQQVCATNSTMCAVNNAFVHTLAHTPTPTPPGSLLSPPSSLLPSRASGPLLL